MPRATTATAPVTFAAWKAATLHPSETVLSALRTTLTGRVVLGTLLPALSSALASIALIEPVPGVSARLAAGKFWTLPSIAATERAPFVVLGEPTM